MLFFCLKVIVTNNFYISLTCKEENVTPAIDVDHKNDNLKGKKLRNVALNLFHLTCRGLSLVHLSLVHCK